MQHGWMLDVGCFITSQPGADCKEGWCSSNGEPPLHRKFIAPQHSALSQAYQPPSPAFGWPDGLDAQGKVQPLERVTFCSNEGKLFIGNPLFRATSSLSDFGFFNVNLLLYFNVRAAK